RIFFARTVPSILHIALLCVRFASLFGRKNLRQSDGLHFISDSLGEAILLALAHNVLRLHEKIQRDTVGRHLIALKEAG
ncbi:MAG: hypothetical protein ACFNLO_07270, partial [Selenomonas massiliensis]